MQLTNRAACYTPLLPAHPSDNNLSYVFKGHFAFQWKRLKGHKQFCADCVGWRISVYIPRLKAITIFKNGSVWKSFPPSLSAKPLIQSSTKGVVILDGWDAGNSCRGKLRTWQVYKGERMKSEAFSVFQRKMMDLKKKIKLTIYPKITP